MFSIFRKGRFDSYTSPPEKSAVNRSTVHLPTVVCTMRYAGDFKMDSGIYPTKLWSGSIKKVISVRCYPTET